MITPALLTVASLIPFPVFQNWTEWAIETIRLVSVLLEIVEKLIR